LYTVVNFYCFYPIADANAEGERYRIAAAAHNLIGTLLIAPEGVNIGVAGTKTEVDAFVAELRTWPELSETPFKYSQGNTRPYKRLFVSIRDSIISFADKDDPTIEQIKTGKRITPRDFNRILAEKRGDVTIVDTRNNYETEYGMFVGAEPLPIKSFREFGKVFEEQYGNAKDKTYVIYCTGGVRCEKAAPYLENRGFKNVLQLDGGMLGYFEEFGSQGFDGSCFVFDRRWIVSPDLKEADDTAPNSRLQPKRTSWPAIVEA
jgi:predicted sulfurtransferase